MQPRRSKYTAAVAEELITYKVLDAFNEGITGFVRTELHDTTKQPTPKIK